MIDVEERPLVRAPLAALDADQPVVGPFDLPQQPVRNAKRAQQRRLLDQRGAVRKVAHRRNIGRVGVELFRHVPRRQLVKGVRLPARGLLPVAVEAHQVVGADAVDDLVGDGAAVVRRGHGDERLDVDALGLQLRDHVAGVEPAHAVRDNVDAPALGVGRDVLGQLGGAVADGAAGGDRGRDDLDVLGDEGFFDAAPAMG